MKSILYTVAFLLGSISLHAQITFPDNGVKETHEKVYSITGVTIHVDHERVIENGTLVIKGERIEKVVEGIKPEKGSVIIDMKGKHIYPSFIDLYSNYGIPEPQKTPQQGGENILSTKPGAYSWNESIHPETRAAETFKTDSKTAAEYRSQGFGSVLTHWQDGLLRGTSAFVTLGETNENNSLILSDAAFMFSFRKGASAQSYPSSLMGNIALIRQTYYDLEWYKGLKKHEEKNLSLESFDKWQTLPQIFEAGDKYNVFRADKIGDEFRLQYVFKTSGNDYQRITEIIKTGGKLIIPVNFPDAYEVEDAYDAMNVSLADMKHWELAPANPFFLEKNKIEFAFTSSDLKEKKLFLPNIRKAIKYGLSEKTALKALTIIPAQILGVQHEVGRLEKGLLANFIIVSENIFSPEAVIYQNWIQGEKFIISETDPVDVRGDYNINIENHFYPLNITGKIAAPKAIIPIDTIKTPVTISANGKNISLSFEVNDANYNGIIRLAGNINFDSGSWDGNGQLPDGTWIKWSAIRNKKFTEPANKQDAKKDSVILGEIWYPNLPYGYDTLKSPSQVLIKNTTVWTNESEGIIKNTDVLLRDGKIVSIGKILDVVDKSTWVIDGTNKHLTSGIIDEHSHIAISNGVNEGGQSVSAEVSIADVVNPDDINIYRQLSGGVTAAQLLHGSANPIGGQSALIKLRWGKSAEEMKISGADGFIKCALGENVKQSNWGENNIFRFPQTRMGVEQTFYDAFYRARAYEKEWKEYESALSSKSKNKSIPDKPRRDLECDILLEILNGKRFITCHSYVQSEINMLMHVADSFDFKINTFTHILEGYKVADKMKAHGVNASTFSDWWAYKYEVMEAIPFNAAILTRMGVNTAINSDDAEMARRLNQEAAKAIKYGGLTEVEAWKLVTLNPAKMLHLDKQTGSIKKDKDADVVLWSDNPLSVYAKAEKTFVDGICYYDREKEEILRDQVQEERSRLIKKMIDAKKNGEPTQKASGRGRRGGYHCETLGEDEEEE
jgi:imidazolonepropionase-like amidohydrolase